MNTSTALPSRQNLYFIAVLIPSPFSEELTHYKQLIADLYGSKAALRVMPHFTLKAPMKLPSHLHESLIKWFQSMPIDSTCFRQEINGFGMFDNKKSPVIYAKPTATEALEKLQKEIIYRFQNSSLKPLLHPLDYCFSPHATVAYRDLTPSAFQQTWPEFAIKEYYASFDVNSFHLLQHNGKVWQPISEYRLVSDKSTSE